MGVPLAGQNSTGLGSIPRRSHRRAEIPGGRLDPRIHPQAAAKGERGEAASLAEPRVLHSMMGIRSGAPSQDEEGVELAVAQDLRLVDLVVEVVGACVFELGDAAEQ